MVARALIDYCARAGDSVTAYARQQLDISDRNAVFDALEREMPDAVINCAAYTNVDGAESNLDACRAANVFGAENLALGAKKIDCAFVTISTDYVFDGTKSGFYTQRDTPNPLSLYAKAKLEGEIRARNAYSRSIIVRSGWIFGAGGTNFLSVVPQLLAEGKQLKVISDSYGTPTFANDLAKRLREFAELDLPCIFHVTNAGDGTSYEGFARKVCEINRFDTKLLESVSVKDLNRPAVRPVSSKLACLFSEKFGLVPLRNWETALAEFLRRRDKET